MSADKLFDRMWFKLTNIVRIERKEKATLLLQREFVKIDDVVAALTGKK